MILTLIRSSWTHLGRDRVAQVMAFVLPIVFFSIFALIFGGRDTGSSFVRVPVALVDESHTNRSRALVRALEADSGLRVSTGWGAKGAAKNAPAVPITRARAEELVREGDFAVALVLPAGIDTSLSRFDGKGVKVAVLHDPSDPVASKMAAGLLQRAGLQALREESNEFRGEAAPGQRSVSLDDMMPVRSEEVAVLGKKKGNGMVAFYAAGIAVMFLMFSASAGGGVLLDEAESGTLERVLSTRLGMTQLLAAKWLYLTSRGVLQIVVMFIWAMLVFHLDLVSHLSGFVVMTAATAACTAAFGLVLATAARTREQLQGMANLVVLSLSAIGGSMFPRFLMSETLQKLSLVGFNAWALDGYLKVFWRESSLGGLLPQVGALAGFTVLFLLLARRFARRWEVA
ncbi:MAG: ABC transporter permease [Candidatus Eisenbacteria bacterium]